MEFRYWSFMEAHPAHTAFPVKARSEAMDVLTWAWTGMFIEFALVSTDTPPQIDSFSHTGLSHPLSAKMNVKCL